MSYCCYDRKKGNRSEEGKGELGGEGQGRKRGHMLRSDHEEEQES